MCCAHKRLFHFYFSFIEFWCVVYDDDDDAPHGDYKLRAAAAFGALSEMVRIRTHCGRGKTGHEHVLIGRPAQSRCRWIIIKRSATWIRMLERSSLTAQSFDLLDKMCQNISYDTNVVFFGFQFDVYSSWRVNIQLY